MAAFYCYQTAVTCMFQIECENLLVNRSVCFKLNLNVCDYLTGEDFAYVILIHFDGTKHYFQPSTQWNFFVFKHIRHKLLMRLSRTFMGFCNWKEFCNEKIVFSPFAFYDIAKLIGIYILMDLRRLKSLKLLRFQESIEIEFILSEN